MAQLFYERSSSGKKGDVSLAYRRCESENRWPAKDTVVAHKKSSRVNGSADRTDASECPARGTNGGGGLPTASSPQQLSSSHNCTLSLLRRRGIDSDVRIGVRGDTQGEIQAHAWLEWNGEVINDAGDVASQYLPLTGRDSIESNCSALVN